MNIPRAGHLLFQVTKTCRTQRGRPTRRLISTSSDSLTKQTIAGYATRHTLLLGKNRKKQKHCGPKLKKRSMHNDCLLCNNVVKKKNRMHKGMSMIVDALQEWFSKQINNCQRIVTLSAQVPIKDKMRFRGVRPKTKIRFVFSFLFISEVVLAIQKNLFNTNTNTHSH